ncbi:MAG TPA: hypothetical protein V6C81_28990 [Planktothrix sp.]|jgi:hypothetical protein
MKASKMRLFNPLALLTLVAALLLGTGSAFAAPTYTPDFNASHHVYVDPQLVGSAISSSQVAQLESDLEQRSKTEGVQYFFVYSLKGDETPAPGQKFASMVASKITSSWQAKSGFPLETYQLILIVRTTDGRNQFTLNGGNLIQKEGLNPQLMDIGNDAFKVHMPNDAAGFADQVADGINGAVSHYHFMHVTLWYIILASLVAAILIVLTFLFLTKSRKMKAVLEKWRQYATHVGQLADQLEGAHMGFLKQQDVFAKTFVGDTKTRFEEARNGFATLNSKQLAIQDLFDRAEAAAKSAVWPMFWKADAVTAMLTTASGTWTGSELPDAKKTLKDFFEKITWTQPQELIDGYDALYTQTDAELKEIADAFRQTTANAAAIKNMLAEIDTTRPALEQEAQLPFAPYQSRYDDLKGRGGKVLDLMGSNPIGAKAESEAVEKGIEKLKSDMLRAVAIKKSYGDTQTAITGATTRAAQVRQKVVEYSYPFVSGEDHPATAAATFLLTEENGDPDGSIKDANTHFGASQTALVAADLDTADAEKHSAEKSAAEANSIIDAVLAAKAYVEQHVTPVRNVLATLRQETPAAETAMAELTANFVDGNYTQVQHAVATAKSVAGATEAQLGQARNAYHTQHFLAAQNTVQSTGSSIDSARAGLAAVHSRLAELRALRDHAKTVTAQVNQLNSSLSFKLQQNSTYTSNATDASLRNQQVNVQTLVRETAKPVCDWVAMAHTADTTLAALEGVDRAIDADKNAHDLAAQRVSELSGAIQTARTTVASADTRQPARNKLNNAIAALSSAQTSLQVAKSDWAAIDKSVEAVEGDVSESVRMAENDHERANEARVAITQAVEKIAVVEGTNYAQEEVIGGQPQLFNGGVNLSAAAISLASAQQSLANRDYEDATSYANTAFNQAEEARQAAVNAVAAAVAAAVTLYNQQQEAIRQAELQAQQQNNPGPSVDDSQQGGFQDDSRNVTQDAPQEDSRNVTGGDEI